MRAVESVFEVAVGIDVFGSLDLDHVGAEIGKRHARTRPVMNVPCSTIFVPFNTHIRGASSILVRFESRRCGTVVGDRRSRLRAW